jgi:hypothetical protein
MKTQLLNALHNTARVINGLDGMNRQNVGRIHADRCIPILMALTPPVFAAFVLGEVGMWAIDEIRRQIRIREKRPDSPSLRGTPTPKEIATDWVNRPRSLATCLRLGSRLADLDPTLDHTLVLRELPSGKKVIRARKGGMKGWLDDHRVEVSYSTVMRYKKLAQRLRRVLDLDDRLPLEWAMTGLPDNQSLSPDLAAQLSTASCRLAKILRENPSLAALSREVERKLGILRLVTVRKAGKRKCKETHNNNNLSIISQGRHANVSAERVASTKTAMAQLLKAKNLSGPALHLQNRLKVWLSGLNPTAP